ncbi:sigma-70 family RNA polymerase sigma factor [Myxococcus sp. CA033]|uniref:sigma-70 family RNA polymerase sigma factor n=1 Tax=Myxococcus sp. CA033 TaxID=2741516 RepID=UPI00157A9743|nr:sigma-70 family RNA polymerase sigma factor [Myxococcus sp. CA033]NTX41331.1 sigma-70 family RNA polymerase sigma factor [Myxococcus sp. CA033]
MDESSLSKLSFEELLVRVRVGENAAREELLRRCLDRVGEWTEEHREQAAKVGARPSDITQDSLLKAFQNLDGFKGTSEGAWWAWLRKLVKNQAFQTYRHGTRQRRDASDTVPLDSEEALGARATERSPSQMTAHQEEWRRLLSGFGLLPESQREALSLFYLEELPASTIAERMDKTPKAVESLMGRGVRALRDYMAEEPDAEGLLSPEVAAIRNAADAAFCKYLRRREAGEEVDPEAFVTEHPDCAEELRGMLHWMLRLRALDPSRAS